MASPSKDASASTGIVTRVEALGYRSLRDVSLQLGAFHVLVGANASGKSTFLDVVAFLGDMVRAGVEVALQGDAHLGIPHRAPDAKHLTWMRRGGRLELAIELGIPEARRQRLKGNGSAEVCRYEVALDVEGPFRLVAETLWLKPARDRAAAGERTLFPEPPEPRETIVHPPKRTAPRGWTKVVSRSEEPERVMFRSETSGWNTPHRLGTDKAALASLAEDEDRFPVATWFREVLQLGVRRLALSSEDMRRPSPPSRARGYLPDGSNLPHVIHALEAEQPSRFKQWVRHVREALPDVESITTREREEDRHRYLILRYRNGLEAPSWLVSDGTLRLLALTLLAYQPHLSGLFLIEEPENGIHPLAVETVFQSLSSAYGAQVLLATHSPVIVSMAELDQVLCFARAATGETVVVPGSEHPRLTSWKGEADPGTLLASGILG